MVTGKELAVLAGEPAATVDHWSDMGLLVFLRRGRRRLYDPAENQARCKRIRELQQDGMSLATMKQLFAGEQPGLAGGRR